MKLLSIRAATLAMMVASSVGVGRQHETDEIREIVRALQSECFSLCPPSIAPTSSIAPSVAPTSTDTLNLVVGQNFLRGVVSSESAVGVVAGAIQTLSPAAKVTHDNLFVDIPDIATNALANIQAQATAGLPPNP
jgi:hypothetical protein